MPRRRYLYVFPLLALTLLLLLMSLPGFSGQIFSSLNASASPATIFTVNSTGDGADSNLGDGVCNDGSGACTLRAAISQANADASADVINFNLPVNSIITLNDTLDLITEDLDINGPGANTLTVQRSAAAATPRFRIFGFDNRNKTVTANISGLTLSNGRPVDGANGGDGGAISNFNANVNLTSMVIKGNSAGDGVSGSGGSGGGILNFHSMIITNSTISDNSTGTGTGHPDGVGGYGGGLFNGGTLTLINSTVSGNTTGGGVAGGGYGGGIYNTINRSLTLINCTVASNHSGSGGFGGGIRNDGTASIKDTVVANNTVSGVGAGPDLSGNFNSQDYNLIKDTADASFTGTTTHDLTGVDPLLGPLAANGGSTFTHALLVGSPAVDLGNSALTTDQRGQPRPIDDQTVVNAAGGNGSDIGAYEAHTFEVNSTADTDDGLCRSLGTGNGCTLREAINAANAELGAELITFAPALTSGGPATITLLTALADLSSDLTISGPGAALLTVQRSNAGGTPEFVIFHVTGGTITIAGLTISNGHLFDIQNNHATLTVSNCIIDGNNEIGIMNGQETNASLVVNDSTISNHTVAGIWNFANLGVIVTAKINNSTISGNGENGILNIASLGSFATLTVNGSTLSGNSIGNGSSGGLDNRAQATGTATATINNSTISANHSTEFWAGGISVVCTDSGSTSSVTLNDSTVSGNFAPPTGEGSGGIIVVTGNNGVNAFVNLRNTIVAGNIHTTATTVSDISGAVDPSSSFNLIGDGSGMTGISNGTNGNKVGTSLAPIDPRLGPLANNGGLTRTHALLSGSPAHDAGNNALVASPTFIGPPFTDQRGIGFTRIVDGPDADTTDTVDIGAFEAQVSVADLADQSINEGGSLSLPFNNGGASSITSVTATSSNTTLVPNDPANISISGSGSSRTLQINPVANGFGTSTITITVNGNNSQTMTDTFLLTVNSVNEAPSFTKGPDQTVNENDGAQTVSNWATNLSPGPANESSQTLTFIVTNNSNPALFGVAPAVSSTGTLTYTPATGVSGTAAVTIAVMDNGGTANGGVDTSPTQSFNINVLEGGALQFSSATFSAAEDGVNTVVTVTRTGGSAGEARVNYATSNNTATAGQDYTSASGTLTFPDGVTTQTFDVAITNDALDEPDESVNLTLTSPAGSGGLGTPINAVLTINDNDPLPNISIADVAITEGDSGTVNANFTVTLSAPSGQTVTVNFATADGTAHTIPAPPGITPEGSDYFSKTGSVTFAPMETSKPVSVAVIGDFTFESNETFFVNLSAPTNATISDAQGTGTINNDDAQGGKIVFSSPSFNVAEIAGSILISVDRKGDTTQAVTVDYETTDLTADGRKDYTTTSGTLRFDAGQGGRVIQVLINMDAFPEANELLQLTLSNPTGGAALGVQATTILQIDNTPWSGPPTNPIDDAERFVRQHYHDFLNREAANDPDGLAFWTNQITECQQPGATCDAELRRINVSAAFFLSIEFQETGYLIERLYKSAYGDATGTSNFGSPHPLPVPVIRFNEFLPDTQRIGEGVVVGRTGWEQVLENNKVAFVLDFVSRMRFTTAYPTTMTPAEFVDALYLHAGVTPSAAERTSVIGEFGGAGTSADTSARARVLRRVAENSTLAQQEKNRAFVLIQYFGYLRRDPNDLPDSDYSGYDFWLTKLNEFDGNFVNAEMVKAFIVSGEYRQRFGP